LATEPPNKAQASETLINPRVLVKILWAAKFQIIGFAMVCFALGCTIAFLLPPIYQAEALLQIREDNSKNGALQSLAGQLGPLGALAGGSLGGDSGQKAIALATLKSHLIIEAYIERKNLLPLLFARKWDQERNQWKSDAVEYVPTLQDGYKKFTKEIFSAEEDKKTGLVTVSVEWKSPADAASWVSDLVADTNAMLKKRAIDEGEANLQYLEAQARKTAIIELQHSLYQLMEVELKKLMIARNSEDFILRAIDPVRVPKKKVRPQRMLIAALSLLLGVLIACTYVLVRKAWTNDSEEMLRSPLQ